MCYRKTFTLNTGDKIPAIGLGSWKSMPNDVEKAVEIALRNGYRMATPPPISISRSNPLGHIDAALAYGNESEVGNGIKNSGVPRSEIWLTTKLDNPWHKRVEEGIESSLKSLGTDYVDLYLMHWPCSTDPDDKSKVYPNWDYVDTWRAMQKLVGTGKVRNIGVSNFGIQHLERLLNDPSCKVTLSIPYPRCLQREGARADKV